MNVAHGLMFHHFHNERHPKGQGSISGMQFARLLDYVSSKHTILSVTEWLLRIRDGNLRNSDVCLTFDDNLRCQFDVAFPVLKKRGLTAFWFINTSPLVNQVEQTELYRYFRTVAFDSVDDFYDAFSQTVSESKFKDMVDMGLARIDISAYLSKYPFYSYRDRWFRFLRDQIFSPENYFFIMDEMI